MSKFIKVTLYGTEVISAIAVSEVTSIGDDGVYTKNGFVRVNESLEQIEAQLLRDEFAKSALTGILANPSIDDLEASSIAHDAYAFADAMLKERSK